VSVPTGRLSVHIMYTPCTDVCMIVVHCHYSDRTVFVSDKRTSSNGRRRIQMDGDGRRHRSDVDRVLEHGDGRQQGNNIHPDAHTVQS